MSKFVLAICVAGAALCTAAAAKESRIAEGDRGLADVVRRECTSVLWTSEASVWQSRMLDPSRLNFLKVGDRIMLPDRCATEKPPKEVQRATLRLFEYQRMIRQARQTEEENTAFRDKLAKVVAERDAAEKKAAALEKQNKDELAVRTKLAEDVEVMNQREKILDISAFGAVAATGVLFLFAYRRQRTRYRNRLQAAEEELQTFRENQDTNTVSVVEYCGRAIGFQRMRRYVKCPFCPEERILDDPQHEFAHLGKAHPHLRLQERPAAEIRKILVAT